MTQLSLGPAPAPPEPTPAPAPVLVAGPVSTPAPVSAIPSHIEVMPGGQSIVLDTMAMDRTGQQPKIRPASYVQWKIGKKDYGFNWPVYIWVENHTDAVPGVFAEHVAHTIRLDKYGTATGFGSVLEMADFNGKGATVGQEQNARVMNTVSDADAPGSFANPRIMYDAIAAGSAERDDPVREVGWLAWLRLRGGNPLAHWLFGLILSAIKDTGIQLTAWSRGAVRGIELLGTWKVGFDFSQAFFVGGTAIRLAPGQGIDFEPTGQRRVVYKEWTGDGKGDRLQYLVNGVAKFELDADGHGYRDGVQVF